MISWRGIPARGGAPRRKLGRVHTPRGIELRRGDQPTMATWRKRLFIATSYITADAAEHFGLPASAP